MVKPKRQLLVNPATDSQAPILTYNAWLSALQDNCDCKACQYLRQLTKYMPLSPITSLEARSDNPDPAQIESQGF